MNDRDESVMRGLPGGGAELSVVLTLRWDDVAALGREASRLAEQRGAPVTLDEAASHRLRTWSSVANAPDERHKAAPPGPATAAIVGSPSPERARPHVGHLSDTGPVASLTGSLTQQAQPPAGANGAAHR
ncbi:hypothetical protein [Streptomyces sp. SP18CS02]|uniref:hypothetical protein n=1 Tax=Streptomyces sp. SP18CS02 TaxID=3002531 RepID=UPI002E768EF8|nr:hypothetical protein [Streptomyces sp. SP18CS02]MEE1752989.1 hypothetical protein [Streptomyces sp. SP18CS02]